MLPHFQSNPLPPQTSDTPSTSKTIEQPHISLVAFPTCDDLDLGGLDLDKPDRSTTSYPHHQSQNIVDVTGADHGLVQKDNQSTSLSSTLHVPLQSGMHPSSNVSGCNDVLMEQIPNPPIPDGLVISDPKRKRSELDGPQSILPPTAPNPKACFRFENLWLREAHCRDIMIASWSKTHGQCLMDRVGSCGKAIWIWGRHFGRNFQRRLDYWRRRMENTKYRHDPTGISLFKEAQTEYLRVLQQQNTYWRQRAKQFWLKDGDSNTAFFHKAVKRRHQSNRIMKLRDNNGLWIERGTHLDSLITTYFNELFNPALGNYDTVINCIQPIITDVHNEAISKRVTIQEVKAALFDMKSEKSPGPDGLNPGFFLTLLGYPKH
nr:Transposon TX1 uncharacterized [Ipomoea batatas]